MTDLNNKQSPKSKAAKASRITKKAQRNRIDVLTDDAKNADIFTAQRWAAFKAWNLFKDIADNIGDFDELVVKEKTAAAKEIRDRFVITIVGSSVSGLAFHATLEHLFDVSTLPYALGDLFEIRYVDSHQRPLQRLLQARDRRIVPRFEFERFLKTDFSKFDAEKTYEPHEIGQFLPRGSAELVAKWNDRSAIKTLADLGDLVPPNTPFVPKALCWEAGNVRYVAQQILDGFNKITNNKFFRDQPDSEISASSTGGPIFAGISGISSGAGRSLASNQTKRFGLRLFPDVASGSTLDAISDKRGTDFVLLATGPGVDITPAACDGNDDKPGSRFLANSQGSFWNPPKMELDVVEPDGRPILILGNGDSAAGGIYSALFKDAEACSYRFLTNLLAHPQFRAWFVRVQAEVDAQTNISSTVTGWWNNALSHKDVQATLFDFPRTDDDPNDGSDSRSLPDGLQELLRTTVQVALAIRADADAPERLKDIEDVPGFMRIEEDFLVESDRKPIRERLLRNAWPENRIIGALLSDQLVLYQENSKEHREIIEPMPLGERNGKPFKFAVPLFKVVESHLVRDELRTREQIFKYVLDCRGATFFALRGNRVHFSRRQGPPAPVPEVVEG